MAEQTHKNIAANSYTHKMLDEMIEARKNSNNQVITKKGIVASLITQAHRRECKK